MNESEYREKLESSKDLFQELLSVCGGKFMNGCGSYLFNGATYEYCEGMFNKQLLLYNLAKKSDSVLEIGTYMSHSLLIMLMSNPNIKITCIDIDDTYTFPTTELLKKRLNADITFIKGSSLDVLPTLTDTYDLFHIDGHHDDYHVLKEFEYCKKLTNKNPMSLLVDDSMTTPNVYHYISQQSGITEIFTPDSDWTCTYFEIKL